MPHESTVNPYEFISDDYGNLRRAGRGPSQMSLDSNAGYPTSDMTSLVQQADLLKTGDATGEANHVGSSHEINMNKPITPSVLTHHEDFDDDDEDSDESKCSESKLNITASS